MSSKSKKAIYFTVHMLLLAAMFCMFAFPLTSFPIVGGIYRFTGFSMLLYSSETLGDPSIGMIFSIILCWFFFALTIWLTIISLILLYNHIFNSNVFRIRGYKGAINISNFLGIFFSIIYLLLGLTMTVGINTELKANLAHTSAYYPLLIQIVFLIVIYFLHTRLKVKKNVPSKIIKMESQTEIDLTQNIISSSERIPEEIIAKYKHFADNASLLDMEPVSKKTKDASELFEIPENKWVTLGEDIPSEEIDESPEKILKALSDDFEEMDKEEEESVETKLSRWDGILDDTSSDETSDKDVEEALINMQVSTDGEEFDDVTIGDLSDSEQEFESDLLNAKDTTYSSDAGSFSKHSRDFLDDLSFSFFEEDDE